MELLSEAAGKPVVIATSGCSKTARGRENSTSVEPLASKQKPEPNASKTKSPLANASPDDDNRLLSRIAKRESERPKYNIPDIVEYYSDFERWHTRFWIF